ncbi:MAG: MBL fold metallo-hydrolase [Vicinamibacterales bacterium]
MRRPARVTVLGCGTSSGVPMVGCACGVCRSDDPRDARLRPSILIEVEDGPRILIDTTPDLRQQALRHPFSDVDAVLYTHAHADHILGLDELRRFNLERGGPVPCYATAETWATILQTFAYAFDGKPRLGGGVPRIARHEIGGPFAVAGIRVVPVPMLHGTMPVLGFRFGDFAYLTDCNVIAEASWPLLTGLDALILDALRDRPHTTHFTLDEARAAAARIGARRTFFTHMTHDLGYAATCARLPEGMTLAYDRLTFRVHVDAD